MTVPWREAIAAGSTLMYVLPSGGAAPETELRVAATATRRMTLLGLGAEDVLLIDIVAPAACDDEVGVSRRCWIRGSSPEYVEDILPQFANVSSSLIQSTQINRQVTRKSAPSLRQSIRLHPSALHVSLFVWLANTIEITSAVLSQPAPSPPPLFHSLPVPVLPSPAAT